MTPLHHAAAAGHVPVVELLVAREANLAATDALGRTTLALARANKREFVIRFLLTHSEGVHSSRHDQRPRREHGRTGPGAGRHRHAIHNPDAAPRTNHTVAVQPPLPPRTNFQTHRPPPANWATALTSCPSPGPWRPGRLVPTPNARSSASRSTSKAATGSASS